MSNLGKTYTKGDSFRAMAEAQQRRYRAEVLELSDDGQYGHRLSLEAAKGGHNFVVPVAHEAMVARAKSRKGISLARTEGNMLSSQAMCFNIFAPLDNAEGRKALAGVLGRFVGDMGSIKKISFEYSPPNSVFGDQSSEGGVDCDLLIEFERGVLGIEIKFAEEAFSSCGFCGPKKGRRCAEGIALDASRSACLYQSKKKYHYWARSEKLATLRPGSIQAAGCPFDGPMWQLWVNHTLIQVEAKRRSTRGVFAVCAPAGNKALTAGGVVDRFKAVLSDEATFALIGLESLVEALAAELGGKAKWAGWLAGVKGRYVVGQAG